VTDIGSEPYSPPTPGLPWSRQVGRPWRAAGGQASGTSLGLRSRVHL